MIGLDDLLSDFYGGKNKTVDKSSRYLKASKGYDSDEDDKRVQENETYLRKFVEDCEKKASVNLLPIFLIIVTDRGLLLSPNFVLLLLRTYLIKLNRSSLKIIKF